MTVQLTRNYLNSIIENSSINDDFDVYFRLLKTHHKFIIFVSYGNDSIALIQYAHENNLKGVAIVFTDTGWSAEGWLERVEKGEKWAKSLGFKTYRTSSIGFEQLARNKKGFPTQRYQWCSYILKIEPGQRWLEDNDPECRAVCLVGVRRDESQDRAEFPEWLINSMNHGGRVLIAPFAQLNETERNAFIERAGWQVLPHRSRECKCINSNRADMKLFTEADWQSIESIENEIGKPMYRAKRHMGATGAAEVRKWANSKKGQYKSLDPENRHDLFDFEDLPPEEDLLGNSGKCGTFGGCGS
ncbi:phosphoadenosine phosphosulfate reductase family protein [Brucella gallinifaecis]|uniref:phosphoadenosine phosphosulfate reductase domain-containing protein n=1 Tax=Brucella gallinifaecis TaxID=215590 RepID=UPI0023623509|nr:phosphoadenosine phosphosulfate reductase family protein [Brucella gallinifaecis]